MYCPKCGEKVVVTNTTHNTAQNETYRLRKCVKCETKFYTVEFEVAVDESFLKEYRSNNRGLIRYCKNRDAELEKRRIN